MNTSKRILKPEFILLAFFMLSLFACKSDTNTKSSSKTGSITEGVVEYNVITEGIDEEENPMAGMMPKTMTGYFKDGQMKLEMSAAMGMFKSQILSNGKDESLVVLMELMGKKVIMENSPEQIADLKKSLTDYTIEKSGDEKEVAGIACTAYTVTSNSGEVQQVYLANTIQPKDINWFLPFKDVQGLPMEFNFSQNEMTLKLEATSVSAEELSESIFEFNSDDYEIMDPEAFKLPGS